jgi:hypothetical protein
MPKHFLARAAQDEQEERQVGNLARSHHAPAEQVAKVQLNRRAKPWIWVGLSNHDASCIVSFGIAFEESSPKETPLPPTVLLTDRRN